MPVTKMRRGVRNNVADGGLISMTLNKAKGRMFKSVGWTWNPIANCTHGCEYCWAAALRKRWGKTFDEPEIREHFFKDKMPDDGSWIFVGSMGDVFCDGVPNEWIIKLLNFIKENKANNIYLLQTKNPRRFQYFVDELREIKDKVVLGTTIETTEDTPWSKAPSTFARSLGVGYMREYEGFKTFLSLEPLADFDLETIFVWIEVIKPEAIEIGLENYTHVTTPPPNWKIVALIQWLSDNGYTYILKENLDYLSSMPTKKSKELQNIENLEIHTNDGSYEGEWDEERHKYR